MMEEHICEGCGGVWVHEPATRCEACQWNLDHPTDPVQMVQELEDEFEEDPESLLGQKVDWYGQVVQFVKFGPKDQIGLRVVLYCERCRCNSIVVAVSGGPSKYDWCYVYDLVTGEYQADLRNQSYVCDTCQAKKQA